MKLVGLILGVVLGLASAVSGQPAPRIWTEWEYSLGEPRGPGDAKGLVIFLHGRGGIDSFKEPLSSFDTEIARLARWDVLRLNRAADADFLLDDPEILRVLKEQVDRARQSGYATIVLTGSSRGAWLALRGAELEGVDGVIAFAPGSVGLAPDLLEAQRDFLAERLRNARARRLALFLFEGDPRENVPGGRGPALQEALQAAGISFMLIDRPRDLYGHSGAAFGRFTRRYRDCVLEFMTAADRLPAGEQVCVGSKGYAVGAEIGLPLPRQRVRLPIFADKAYGRFIGRWEGDDEWGGYVILQAVEVGDQHITFRHGYAPPPAMPSARPWIRDFRFVLDGAGGLVAEHYGGAVAVTLKPFDFAALHYTASFDSGRSPPHRFVLSRVSP